jgi:hypothetical protein
MSDEFELPSLAEIDAALDRDQLFATGADGVEYVFAWGVDRGGFWAWPSKGITDETRVVASFGMKRAEAAHGIRAWLANPVPVRP